MKKCIKIKQQNIQNVQDSKKCIQIALLFYFASRTVEHLTYNINIVAMQDSPIAILC